ncbi:MAG TPA: biotin/lipoyl-binding protein, partial [Candidatus Limnocylindrales bacterium]|nr:biotin/lipoyl-binding protein [Candidatus Limnocylindrales bacterium]
MKSGKRNMIWITVVLVFIVLLGAGIVLTVRRNAEARRQPDEMLVLVERGDLKVWVTGNSSVSAALEETVRTDVTGTIETYLLYEGQVVSAGDQLATLSVQELSIQIERARLDVSMRERELNNLKEEQTTTVVSAP